MDPFFRPKTVIGRHKILAHRRQNLSRVKTGQNRLINKTVIKLVDHLIALTEFNGFEI